MNDEERQRAGRFLRDEDRRRFVTCRAVLRHLLAAHLGVAPAEICFALGEFGRPSLASPARHEPIDFNVSHSGERGLIAFGKQPVGVDVERIRLPHGLDLLSKSVLSAREQEHWLRLPKDQQLTAFFRYWTLKEAVLKLSGHGLSQPLGTLEIDLESPRRFIAQPLSLPANPGFLQELELGEGYCAALAAGGPQPSIQGIDLLLD